MVEVMKPDGKDRRRRPRQHPFLPYIMAMALMVAAGVISTGVGYLPRQSIESLYPYAVDNIRGSRAPAPGTTGSATVSPPVEGLSTPIEELSTEERYKLGRYMSHDDNITIYRARKPTPSGWWPDKEWIQQCIRKPRDLTPFSTIKEWELYRLGDCVKKCAGCPIDGDPVWNNTPTLAHWTIGGEYYDRDCLGGRENHMPGGNETLLLEIVSAREGKPEFSSPDPQTVVMHLRLGDKVEDSPANIFTQLHKGANPGGKNFQRIHAIKSLYELLTSVVESGASKVSIRGGSQIPDKYKKSKTYAYCVHEAVKEAGYESEINLDEGNADVDFMHIVQAKKMISTVGGFSRYLGHLVEMRGGVVYGRQFAMPRRKGDENK